MFKVEAKQVYRVGEHEFDTKEAAAAFAVQQVRRDQLTAKLGEQIDSDTIDLIAAHGEDILAALTLPKAERKPRKPKDAPAEAAPAPSAA